MPKFQVLTLPTSFFEFKILRKIDIYVQPKYIFSSKIEIDLNPQM